MSTVYIPQEPMVRDKVTGEFRALFSLEPAMAYGSPKTLFDSKPVIFDTVRIVRHLNKELANFSDDDWIICVGDPSLLATTVAIAQRFNGGRFGLLKWDRRAGRYAELRVDLSGKPT